MESTSVASGVEDGTHQTKHELFPLPQLPRELRDMIYELILSLYPRLIVRKHLKDKSYARTAAFDARHRLVVAGLEFNRGSTALVAMLLASKPTEAVHRLGTHHVQCELRDPVYGWKPPKGGALYIREEAEFASSAADLSINVSFSGDTLYDMRIDTAVFDDIRGLFDRCNQARNLVLVSDSE